MSVDPSIATPPVASPSRAGAASADPAARAGAVVAAPGADAAEPRVRFDVLGVPVDALDLPIGGAPNHRLGGGSRRALRLRARRARRSCARATTRR